MDFEAKEAYLERLGNDVELPRRDCKHPRMKQYYAGFKDHVRVECPDCGYWELVWV